MENDPLAEIKASFFVECEELIESLHDGLQAIENDEDDSETINIVFRAVHSIKGGAGAFGLEGLVRFSHRFETVLDEVRSGRVAVSADTLRVFFLAADRLSDIIRANRDEEQISDLDTARILQSLDDIVPGGQAQDSEIEADDDIVFQPTGLCLDLDLPEETDGPDVFDPDSLPPPPDFNRSGDGVTYQIWFTPQAELFETGNEPEKLFRNLRELGEMQIKCDVSDLPSLAHLTPQVPHLSWALTLETVAAESEISALFEFVDGLCDLKIETGSADKPDVTGADDGITPEASASVAAPKESIRQDGEKTEKSAAEPYAESSRRQVSTAKPPPPKTVVRVDLDRIERLVNLVGELVINQAMLSQSLQTAGLSPHSDAMGGLEEFHRLTRDIQDSVMMIRAQPVKSLFQRMTRIVREASSAVGKDVRLHTVGDATEVDKTVIERLADPLTHMIRNAVDHGLESADERRAADKPSQGRITLSAMHRSGRVIIEVSDDGAGIDRAKVLQIATEKGLVPADKSISETDIDNILFLPGFSTASEVSDLSGRGVGMDVVKTAIEALSGRISITSEPGHGTTIAISLPLTLAVLDGMVIEVAGETLVLPLNVVVETLKIRETDVHLLEAGSRVVRVRDAYVPLFDLGAALGYRQPTTSQQDGVVLLISQDSGDQVALAIDAVLDQRQVVIKGLDDSFYRAPGIAAATILGDGQIALILDPTDIVASTSSTLSVMPDLQEMGMSA